ncbi:HAD-IA family hydrolase [Allobranchiibius sp. GilTou73]|uniref:HAD-IA family hydrolase n=1 Tax=Allobranchiibius sp. GilTou73 TaxID=2904523 RepID=UPI001F1D83CF|nr:HAD-IA family hydrolase [Allobranchiibius sp. GilTou73]UIJ35951.1 HAD-IA family hydrolase [Allobranchiibius sp. GilTou73]
MVSPALIFDCDGVLADTERDGHRPAFNAMFDELGVPAHWDEQEYGEKLRIGGGKERMASLFKDPQFARRFAVPPSKDGQAELLSTWHEAKGVHFRRLVSDGAVRPRPGITRIITAAVQAGWTVAVASTSARPSVYAVLEAAVGHDLADAIPIFAGDVVSAKKPDPQIYLLAVSELGLERDQVLVIEDSRNGLRAAVGAGLRCLVTTSSYTREEDFSEACLVISSLGDPGGPPLDVLADRAGVPIGDFVSLEDLRACISSVNTASTGPTKGDSA